MGRPGRVGEAHPEHQQPIINHQNCNNTSITGLKQLIYKALRLTVQERGEWEDGRFRAGYISDWHFPLDSSSLLSADREKEAHLGGK